MISGHPKLSFKFEFEILLIKRLYLTSDLQRNTCLLCHLDSNVSALDRRDPAEEGKVLLLLVDHLARGRIDAMVDGADARKLFEVSLEVADSDIVNVGKLFVELAKVLGVGMVNRIDERDLHKA